MRKWIKSSVKSIYADTLQLIRIASGSNLCTRSIGGEFPEFLRLVCVSCRYIPSSSGWQLFLRSSVCWLAISSSRVDCVIVLIGPAQGHQQQQQQHNNMPPPLDIRAVVSQIQGLYPFRLYIVTLLYSFQKSRRPNTPAIPHLSRSKMISFIISIRTHANKLSTVGELPCCLVFPPQIKWTGNFRLVSLSHSDTESKIR